MAVNLTPQYHEAEANYKKAQTPEQKMECLKRMWVELPKHKASEKLQAELKTKISELRDEIEEGKSKKKGGTSHKIPRQGAGQVMILGAPNSGKSKLLASLTRATPEVAPYPFTTREPYPGMMDWEDVRVQLIDTPPITPDVMEPYLSSMIRNANAAVLLLDLQDDDGVTALEAVVDRLSQVKTMLVAQIPDSIEDPTVDYCKTIIGASQLDTEDAPTRLEMAMEVLGNRFPIYAYDAETGKGLDQLRQQIYQALNVIRIYSKRPGKPADMEAPFTCPLGSSVLEMAERVHGDLAEKLKSARIWGTGVFDGQTVTRDHILHDRDIVELHA